MFSNVGSFRRDRAQNARLTMEKTLASAREQIKRDLQRVHDLVLLTLDVLVHSMKYDGT